MSTLAITKTQDNLQPIDKTVPYAVIETDILEDENLSNAEFRVLAILLSYASKQGFCNITNKTLEAKYSFLKERNFQKICKHLEDKHYIARIHHPLHKRGSMRYLVPAQHHDKFIKYILKKHHAFKYAAQIKTFFEGGDEEAWEKAFQCQYSSYKIVTPSAPKKQIPLPSTRTLCAAPSDPNVMCGSINNINIIKEEEDSVEGKSPPLFKDSVRKELSKLKLDPQKGMKLYQTCQKEFDAYDNPVAGIVAALKGGYADEKIHKSEEKRAKESQAHDEREKKAERKEVGYQIAKTIQKHCDEQEVRKYRVYVDEYHAQIDLKDTRQGWYFDYGGDPKSVDRLLAFSHQHNIKIDLHKENKNEG